MDLKLYFITAIDTKKSYQYLYVLATSKDEAKSIFLKTKTTSIIKSIKALYPSKRNMQKINESYLYKKLK